MLVLTRKVKQGIRIGDDITIIVKRCSQGSTTFAIDAPKDVRILREELEPEAPVETEVGGMDASFELEVA